MTDDPQRDLERDGELATDPDPRPVRGVLRTTAMLPALFTVMNGVLGFASIHFATKDALGAATMSHLSIAAWLIGAAMVCDMLDGLLARMTRRTSDFGAQLDSLSDMISFGVAPAVLMLRTVTMALKEELIGLPPQLPLLERAVWVVAAAYVACAALRLARFNVENESDESAHMNFRGLPSPGAAATIVAMVLLFAHLSETQAGLLHRAWMKPWMGAAVGIGLPIITLAIALLMVSRLTYPHIVNQYVRGKRPFGHLVRVIVIGLFLYLELYVSMAAGITVFALSGPVGALWRRRFGNKATKQDPVT